MDRPRLKAENVDTLLDTRFIKVFDLHYREGKHYYDAVRRGKEDLVALKSDDEFKHMLPDAVTVILVVKTPEEEPRLYMSYEFRYPAGQYLLSPPAGLMDPEDREKEAPLFETAKREIFEECGITVKETDTLQVVTPLSFSTPGMTDESNALVLAAVTLPDLSTLTQEGGVGGEMFLGYELLTKKEAAKLAASGRDRNGNFFSIYTYTALLYFISHTF